MWKRYFFISCSAIFAIVGKSTAQYNDTKGLGHPVKFAMPILVIAPDARAGGIGDVGVATMPATNDQNWNAAKYAFIESKTGISLSYIPWLKNVGASNINLFYLTGYHRFDNKNSIGASLRYFSVGSLEFLTESGERLHTVNPTEWAVDFSYSRLLGDNFSMSLTGRYILSDLSGGYSDDRYVRISSAGAIAADVGLYYNRPVYWGNRDGLIALGMAISNVGSKMNYSINDDEEHAYFLPTTLRIGGAWATNFSHNHDISVNLELSKYLVPTPDESGIVPNVSVFEGMIKSLYDAPGGFSEKIREIMLGVGAEYTYVRQFTARAGYYHDSKSPNRQYFTVGAGIRYQMIMLDLAYLIPTLGFSNPLANTIRISISVDFGKTGHKRRQPQSKDNNGNSGFFKY